LTAELVGQRNLFVFGVAENVRAKLARQTLVSAKDLLSVGDSLREKLINPARHGPSNLAHRAGILCDNRIAGYQQDAFDRRLSDKQAIEGVLVDRRQVGNGNDVLAGNPRVLYHRAGGQRQALGLTSRPQQQLRIQQQLHEWLTKSCSISELPIRSKSSGTSICPTMNPSRRA
jgi:hypothetical protein